MMLLRWVLILKFVGKSSRKPKFTYTFVDTPTLREINKLDVTRTGKQPANDRELTPTRLSRENGTKKG